MTEINQQETYSPAEFALLFKRHPTWGYRRIYSGAVKVLQDAPRLTIPRAEVEAFVRRIVVHEQARKSTARRRRFLERKKNPAALLAECAPKLANKKGTL